MSPELETRVRKAFRDAFGSAPTDIAFAPGRVNLIGEHVDYNEGLVLPMPIPMGTAVAWSTSEGREIEVHAADLDESDSFCASDPAKPDSVGWTSYVRGMAAKWGMEVPPMRIAICGDLPRGSGLSSSASLCIAMARAFAAAGGTYVDPTSMAKIAQATEHDFAGVACGIMDQMAVAAGEPGHAMLLDCRDLTYRQIEMPDDWAVLVVASGVTRGLVDGEYNARRKQCELASATLGVASLRDTDLQMLSSSGIPEPTMSRARHVVEEIERVEQLVSAIARSDIAATADIMRAGHASLRDDFEVSVGKVDELVDALNDRLGERGGARMTGAGFGGSVVVICEQGLAAQILDEWPTAAVRVA